MNETEGAAHAQDSVDQTRANGPSRGRRFLYRTYGVVAAVLFLWSLLVVVNGVVDTTGEAFGQRRWERMRGEVVEHSFYLFNQNRGVVETGDGRVFEVRSPGLFWLYETRPAPIGSELVFWADPTADAYQEIPSNSLRVLLSGDLAEGSTTPWYLQAVWGATWILVGSLGVVGSLRLWRFSRRSLRDGVR